MSEQEPKLSAAEKEVLAVANDPVLRKMLDDERVEASEVDTRLLFRLARYIRRYPGLGAIAVVLAVIEAMLMTLPAFVIGLAIDRVTRGEEAVRDGWLPNVLDGIGSGFVAQFAGDSEASTWVVFFGLIVAAAWTGRWFIAVTTTYLVQTLGQHVVHDLRTDVYNHITGMDLGYFHKNPVGRLVNRTTFDVQSIAELFSDAFAQGLRDVLFITVLVIVMLGLDVPLSALLIATFPVLIAIGYMYRWLARPALRTMQAVQSRMNAWIAENIAGMRENHLYRQQARRTAEFKQLTEAHQKSVTRWISAWGVLRPSMMFVSAIATCAVLLVGYNRVLSGAITVGVLLTFVQYTSRLWVPVRNLTQKFNLIQTALTAGERIFDVLDTEAGMTDSPDADPERRVRSGDVEFEDVRFKYSPNADEVIRGINFEVKNGDMLALVGDTGAGKTTIASLISRFYDVSEGVVRVDGKDVRSLTLQRLREGVGIVPQDVVIFAGTLRENITLGIEVDDQVVLDALGAVRAEFLLERWEDGLDHVLDEGGRTLSVGERQLLSFARALVFNPPVLILDEATANVDTETELRIQNALEKVTKGRTSIVIAHRLSTIREADQILVLRHGEIVERGRHEELLALGGEYSRLHQLHIGKAA